MLTKMSFKIMKTWLIVMAAVILLVSACGLSEVAPTSNVVSTDAPQDPGKPASEPAANSSPSISLDTANIAAGFWVDIVPAGDKDGPSWAQLPEYSMVTLDEYVIKEHHMQPQIFIFPVEALSAANPEASEIADLLEILIQAPQDIPDLPFLPLLNEKQVFHTQLQYMDFISGHGLRYLAMFSQGIVPVNNVDLIYTFQGLTDDGKYYVSAILPITHPSLPADETITGSEPAEFSDNYLTYLQNAVAALNLQAPASFVPELSQIDAMFRSLTIE